MPYDAVWAQKVYKTYAKLHTRVQQIDACIQQMQDQNLGSHCPVSSIAEALIQSIRSTGRQSLWTQYKRLVKRTPLDQALLLKIAKEVYWAVYEIDVEKKQRQFEFIDTSS